MRKTRGATWWCSYKKKSRRSENSKAPGSKCEPGAPGLTFKEEAKNMTIPLEKIVGEQLSSVEFVQDYVQLHFDGPTITAFVWPTLNLGGNIMCFGDAGYRDALCARI